MPKIEESLKEILDIGDYQQITVTKVTNGYNIRFRHKANTTRLRCMKCGKIDNCERHHVIPKSAGGRDDQDNLIDLCRKCHKDKHDSKWEIEEVVPVEKLEILRRRYNVIKE
jgi:5-methylcytosine-specific restriction endonuclease McrA